MEIKLSAGDKITIPENCKAAIEDNLIIIEEQKEEFKDGDILRSTISNRTIIFKSYKQDSKRICDIHYNNCDIVNSLGWDISHYYLATEEEKQAFFNELYTKGLRWNADTKTMERIRRRAEIGERYLYICLNGEIIEGVEDGTSYDDNNFNSGKLLSFKREERSRNRCKSSQSNFWKEIENLIIKSNEINSNHREELYR